MYGEMMHYYGLVKDFDKTDYFETEAFKSVLSSLEIAVLSGGIITLTGLVGVGKTTMIRHFQEGLKKKNQVIVAKSLATDKRRVNINTLYTALFADLPTAKEFKVPTQAEIRERKLQELVRKINKPIAFFIDGAHDLHWRTLIGLKQLIETIEDAKGTLTIIMVGHPKLGNDLNRPAMEEIGARAKLFSLDSWGQQKQRYIEWLLEQCSKPKTPIHDIVATGCHQSLGGTVNHAITNLPLPDTRFDKGRHYWDKTGQCRAYRSRAVARLKHPGTQIGPAWL
jgi:type II secretory pathway predicted ATPase ExeA